MEIEALIEQVADTSLRERIEKLATERERYRELYLDALEKIKKLERGLLGQKAERLAVDDAQLTMALLSVLLDEGTTSGEPRDDAVSEDESKVEVAGHARRKSGRKPLPEHLPRVDVEILPPEVQAEGLDAFEQIGEEVTEVLERRSARVVVVRVVRKKFVRKDRERNAPTEVWIGEVPDQPIPRGLAGPGMLADTLVRRWQDHMPVHRLEQMYAREGLDIVRSTICGWHAQLMPLVEPVVEAMRQDAFTSPLLLTDATGVLVRAKEKCHRSHFWVVIAPGMHVLFRFTPKHDSDAVDRILEGYEGYLVADAATVYDHLYADGTIIEVGCWAHNRRYYFKALGSDPERARQALAPINGLFRIERKLEAEGASRATKQAVRREKSKPLVDTFFDWCDREADRVLDDTPIAKAIGYSRNQRQALHRFLDDGRLPLHNNGSELQLRRQAIGRKNWLFVGHDDAAAVNCAFVSLLASCQLHKLEPWAYLRDILCLLPAWPNRRVLELAPAYWKQTLEQPDTRQRLEANPFRRITLREHLPDG